MNINRDLAVKDETGRYHDAQVVVYIQNQAYYIYFPDKIQYSFKKNGIEFIPIWQQKILWMNKNINFSSWAGDYKL